MRLHTYHRMSLEKEHSKYMLDAAGQQVAAATGPFGPCATGVLANAVGAHWAARLPPTAVLQTGADDERQRIARQLHDAVSQTLFAANLLAGALARSADHHEVVRAQARVLERLHRSALAEMRMMLFELQPEALANVRMAELLQQAVDVLVGRGGVQVSTDINDASPLPTHQRIEVYRIAQAVLSNIARHSGASHAHLQWSTSSHSAAVLRVWDDGCGFETDAEMSGHFGLARIRERAAHLGADLNLSSALGEGTEIILTLNRSEKNP